MDCCLDDFPASQISRLRWRRIGAGGGAQEDGALVENDVTTVGGRRFNILLWLQHDEVRDLETRCESHLHVFLPPCLIRVRHPSN